MHVLRRNRFHSGIAVFVCSLILVFAVGAKVAWYHTSDQSAKPIASAKMWQMLKAAPNEDEKASIAAQPVILLLLIDLLVAAHVLLCRDCDQSFPGTPNRLFPPLAVRPPPAL